MIEPTRVLALRHGETAWNADFRLQGQLDVPLNNRGHWQAGRLAAALQDQDVSAVYASDLTRALQTAQALALCVNLPVRSEPGLRERGFGCFEGQSYGDIHRRWPAQALRWRQRDPAFEPAGGESLVAFNERSLETASRLAARHPGELIALVSHGGVLDCLYRAGTGIGLSAPRTWRLGNAVINRLLYNPGGFAVVGWNDDAHLDEPGVPEPVEEKTDRAGARPAPSR